MSANIQTNNEQKEQKTPLQSGGIFSNLIKKIRPSARSSRPSENENNVSKRPLLSTTTNTTPSSVQSETPKSLNILSNKQNQTKIFGAPITTTAGGPIGSQKTNSSGAGGTGGGRKIVVNAGQKVIRLDNNLYLIKNPMAGGKGSGNFQKPTQKNFIIAKCTCKQR